MTCCKHITLVLLPDKKNRLRCTHCHLTITTDDLKDRYCPECFEIHRAKRYDFEDIIETESEISRYRCEECGVIIESA